MTTSEQVNEIAAALAKAQATMAGAKRDSANPFFKSKYADLASVWEACRDALTANGLAVVQSPSADADLVSVTTTLLHSSGQWLRGTVSATPKDTTPQSVGSCVTYLRRYALQSFVGVAPEDDDAEAAQGRTSAAKPAAAPSAPPKYAEWLTDLEATADTGTAALQKSWKSPAVADFRTYLTSHQPATWEKIKARAASADKAASA